MSDKTLVERLREVNSNRIKHPVCQIANAVGVGCGGRTCDECGTDTAHALADAIEREYLPRPRFEDGEPVQFGDKFESAGIVGTVDYILKGNVEGCVIGRKEDSGCVTYPNGKRVKRPAPEVLDADGVPIRKGDTVWNVDSGRKYTVTILPRNRNEYEAVGIRTEEGVTSYYDPPMLTHKQPVLDADDVPIRVGDTVWLVKRTIDDGPFKVTAVKPGEVSYETHDGRRGTCFAIGNLTHKEPDSLLRIQKELSDLLRGYGFEHKVFDLLRRQREVLEHYYER